MKQLLLGITAAALVLSASCKKDEDPPVNNWKVGTTMYLPDSVYVMNNLLVATSRKGTAFSSFIVQFYGTTIPAGGVYKVVGYPQAADQLSFHTNSFDGTNLVEHASVGIDQVQATVSTGGGRVRVTIPPARAQRISGMGPTGDTAIVSADLIQIN